MIPFLRDLIADFFAAATRVPFENWIYIFAAVVAVGVFWLRGYGSRSKY